MMMRTRIATWPLVLALVTASFAVCEAPAAAQGSRALFVAAPSLPHTLCRAVPDALSWESQLVDSTAYIRAAEEQGLAPSGSSALQWLGPHQGADVIVVAAAGSRGVARLLLVHYYDGQTGVEIRAGTYRLRGLGIPRAVNRAIARDFQTALLRSLSGSPDRSVQGIHVPDPEALGAVEDELTGEGENESSDGQERQHDEESEESESIQESAPTAAPEAWAWGFDLAAGLGFGQRESSMPMEAEGAHFSSSPFPAVHVAFDLWLRPSPGSSLRAMLGVRYYTSVGLQAADQRADGSTQMVNTRAQNLALGLKLNFPLVDGPLPIRMDVEAGWGFRMLDSEFQMSMPTYTLSGLYGRAGVVVPIGKESPLSFGLAAELGYINSVSEEAAVAAAVSGGARLGIEVQVRYDIIAELDVAVSYRGSHIFLPSEWGGTMTDVERFGVVRMTYRP